MTPPRLLPVLIAAVLGATTLMSCAGSKSDDAAPTSSTMVTPAITNRTPLTHQALVRKLNEYCQVAGAELGDLPLAIKRAAENNDYETSADIADKRVAVGSRTMANLRTLGTPPARDTAAFNFFLNANQRREDAIADLPGALRDHNLDAVKAALNVAGTAGTDARAAAKTLGARDCV